MYDLRSWCVTGLDHTQPDSSLNQDLCLADCLQAASIKHWYWPLCPKEWIILKKHLIEMQTCYRVNVTEKVCFRWIKNHSPLPDQAIELVRLKYCYRKYKLLSSRYTHTFETALVKKSLQILWFVLHLKIVSLKQTKYSLVWYLNLKTIGVK